MTTRQDAVSESPESRDVSIRERSASSSSSSLSSSAHGIKVGHGRTLRVGQVWKANDPRRYKAVRVLSIDDARHLVIVENLQTENLSEIAWTAFTIGSRGWSLETNV